VEVMLATSLFMLLFLIWLQYGLMFCVDLSFDLVWCIFINHVGLFRINFRLPFFRSGCDTVVRPEMVVNLMKIIATNDSKRFINACSNCCRELMERDPISYWRSIHSPNYKPACYSQTSIIIVFVCYNWLGLDPLCCSFLMYYPLGLIHMDRLS